MHRPPRSALLAFLLFAPPAAAQSGFLDDFDYDSNWATGPTQAPGGAPLYAWPSPIGSGLANASWGPASKRRHHSPLTYGRTMPAAVWPPPTMAARRRLRKLVEGYGHHQI